MKNKYFDESRAFNDSTNNYQYREIKTELKNLKKKYFTLTIIFIFLILINLIFIIFNIFHKSSSNKNLIQTINKENNIIETPKVNNEQNNELNQNQIIPDQKITINKILRNVNNNDYLNSVRFILSKEKERPYLEIINKKRTFENKLPLSSEITCTPHLTDYEVGAVLSFLNKDTVYFETGSGCSSIIAKHYAKKSYAVEGCKVWYEKGIENGLKDNLIFKDLKPDNSDWSYPGRTSTLEDWKNYFQAYDKSYKADVILIDGRFKIATAMDIYDKIEEDTIVLIHEYPDRPSYFVLENYYQFVYIWDRLAAFVKKKDVQSIPLEVQKKYWNQFL